MHQVKRLVIGAAVFVTLGLATGPATAQISGKNPICQVTCGNLDCYLAQWLSGC